MSILSYAVEFLYSGCGYSGNVVLLTFITLSDRILVSELYWRSGLACDVLACLVAF